MTLKEIQAAVEKRRKANNWTEDMMSRCRHLRSEMAELEDALFIIPMDPENVGKEIHDIIWNLCAIANLLSIDIQETYIKKEKELDKRSDERNRRELK